MSAIRVSSALRFGLATNLLSIGFGKTLTDE